jgi:hypothetical protein
MEEEEEVEEEAEGLCWGESGFKEGRGRKSWEETS